MATTAESSLMDSHNAAVKLVSSQVKGFYDRQKPFRLYHGSTNSTRTSSRRADNTVDTSRLNHVLKVDKQRMTALVEPNVPMDDLIHATLKHGLVPPVVMEFPGITVGGGFSGTSGESSSFRHGAFDTTIDAIEIVLADGTVTMASKKERQELFWGAASAFGTLGVVTMLEIQLRETKSYVKLEYELVKGDAGAAMRKMREACDDGDNDFVDGIVFSMDSTIICTGRLVDEVGKGYSPQRFTRRKDPWFYVRARNVQKKLMKQASKPSQSTDADAKTTTDKAQKQTMTDYVPLEDYLFRYDRGGFWVGKYSFRYFFTPFNRITRFVLDKFMHTRVMYRAVHKSGLADYYMVQDVGVPFDRSAEFQAWLDSQFHLYPLWLCPLRIRRDDPDSRHGLHSHFADADTPDLMNFGVWGPLKGNPSRREVVEQNRALERKVLELGGKKWLYAHAYYTEEEFWAHYDRASYDSLRVKYNATHLPSVYDKVKVDVDAEEAATAKAKETVSGRLREAIWGRWPVRGLYGFYGAAKGGDYLMGKKRWDRNSEKS